MRVVVVTKNGSREATNEEDLDLEAFARRIKVVETNFARPKRSSMIITTNLSSDKRLNININNMGHLLNKSFYLRLCL